MGRRYPWSRTRPAWGVLRAALAFAATGCSGATLTTTILPPHRLEDPVCPLAVIVHQSPNEVPPGGRLIARMRLDGGHASVSSEKVHRRLREEAAKLGANRVLAVEVTTPSTLAALGMTLIQGWGSQERDNIRNEALTDQQRTTAATAPVPTDPGFHGHGLA